MRVDYGSQAAAAGGVVERLGGRPFGLIAELGVHPSGVHDTAEAQVIELLAVDLRIAISPSQRIQRPDAEAGYRQRNSAGSPDRPPQHDEAVGADVERAGLSGH